MINCKHIHMISHSMNLLIKKKTQKTNRNKIKTNAFISSLEVLFNWLLLTNDRSAIMNLAHKPFPLNPANIQPMPTWLVQMSFTTSVKKYSFKSIYITLINIQNTKNKTLDTINMGV